MSVCFSSFCLSVFRLSVFLPFCLTSFLSSFHLSVFHPFCLFLRLTVSIFFCLSIFLSFYLFVFLPFCLLSFCLSIFLSFYLSVFYLSVFYLSSKILLTWNRKLFGDFDVEVEKESRFDVGRTHERKLPFLGWAGIGKFPLVIKQLLLPAAFRSESEMGFLRLG